MNANLAATVAAIIRHGFAASKEDFMVEVKRRFSGLSALSRRVGASTTHVHRILSGERSPSPVLRRKLERLGVRFDEAGKAVSL